MVKLPFLANEAVGVWAAPSHLPFAANQAAAANRTVLGHLKALFFACAQIRQNFKNFGDNKADKWETLRKTEIK